MSYVLYINSENQQSIKQSLLIINIPSRLVIIDELETEDIKFVPASPLCEFTENMNINMNKNKEQETKEELDLQ